MASCQPSPVGEGGSRRLTDEVSIMAISLCRQRTDFARARLTPVSATPTEFAPQIGQFPTGKGVYPLFLLLMQAQKKKLSKRKTPEEAFALCGVRQELRVTPSRRRRHTCFAYVSIPRLRRLPQKAGENFNCGGNYGGRKLLLWRAKNFR